MHTHYTEDDLDVSTPTTDDSPTESPPDLGKLPDPESNRGWYSGDTAPHTDPRWHLDHPYAPKHLGRHPTRLNISRNNDGSPTVRARDAPVRYLGIDGQGDVALFGHTPGHRVIIGRPRTDDPEDDPEEIARVVATRDKCLHFTIPLAVCNYLGLREGDMVVFKYGAPGEFILAESRERNWKADSHQYWRFPPWLAQDAGTDEWAIDPKDYEPAYGKRPKERPKNP